VCIGGDDVDAFARCKCASMGFHLAASSLNNWDPIVGVFVQTCCSKRFSHPWKLAMKMQVPDIRGFAHSQLDAVAKANHA